MSKHLAAVALVVMLILGGAFAAKAQDEPLDGDVTNLATVQLGEATFHLDAQLPDVGCSVEITP